MCCHLCLQVRVLHPLRQILSCFVCGSAEQTGMEDPTFRFKCALRLRRLQAGRERSSLILVSILGQRRSESMKRKSALLGILAQCKWLLHCEPSSRPDSAPSLVSDKICCLHSSFFCDLDLCKDLCRMKRKSHRADSCQSWMCACLHKKKC